MGPNDRVRAIYAVLRLPDVRRIELGRGASVIGELAAQVTLVVYAFDIGGAVLVATYGAAGAGSSSFTAAPSMRSRYRMAGATMSLQRKAGQLLWP